MFKCFRLTKKKLIVLIILVFIIILIAIFFTLMSFVMKPKGIEVPILTYHSISMDDTLESDTVITPITLEKDLLYLQENGYNTIFVSDLINYVYQNTPLPENPIILTFDDGYYNNMKYAIPLLEKYDMKAVFSIEGDYAQLFSTSNSNSINFERLSWENIVEATESQRIEIANKTYSMHYNLDRRGCMIMENESLTDYKSLFIADVMKLQTALQKYCKIKPLVFSYPFGLISDESIDIIKSMGFCASLSNDKEMNYITSDKNCLFGLNRYSRPSGISTKKFMKKILN